MAKRQKKARAPIGANRRAVGQILPTEPRQDDFLAAIREFPNIKAACRSTGIDRQTHYNWLKDPAYAKKFADAKKEGAEVVHAEMWRRGVLGVPRLKFNNGQVCVVRTKGKDGKMHEEPYVEMEYSDGLLTQLAKAHDPENFREKFDLKHTGEIINAVRVMRIDGPDPYPPKGKK
jgi:hypothetical protein